MQALLRGLPRPFVQPENISESESPSPTQSGCETLDALYRLVSTDNATDICTLAEKYAAACNAAAKNVDCDNATPFFPPLLTDHRLWVTRAEASVLQFININIEFTTEDFMSFRVSAKQLHSAYVCSSLLPIFILNRLLEIFNLQNVEN